MEDLNDRGNEPSADDDLNAALSQTGARAADLTRMAEVATSMHMLEWKLMRKAAAAETSGIPPLQD